MKLSINKDLISNIWIATIEAPDMQRLTARGKTEESARWYLERMLESMLYEVRT
jgi:hypothetical protein